MDGKEAKNTVNEALQNEQLGLDKRRVRIPQDSCYDMVMTIQLISLTPECRLGMVEDGSVVKVFFSILSGLNDVIRHEMVCSLCNLASSRECREGLVEQGAIELLVILSDSPYPDTQAQCASALGYLSENTMVKNGTCASLLLLSLKSEEMKESLSLAANGQRKRSENDEHSNSFASPHNNNVSAPAKELLALQNVKSLTVMIRDGLTRHQEKHGVATSVVTDTDSVESQSVETFRGTSLEDLNAIGYAELTPYENEVLKRDYSKYEYAITTHPVSQEGGGVSMKQRVELPYPAVAAATVETERTAVGDLFQIDVSNQSLPKNEDALKVLDGRTTTVMNDNNEADDKFMKMKGNKGKTSAHGRQEKYMNRQMSSADETIRPPGERIYIPPNSNLNSSFSNNIT